jgi:hypothetical protein
VKRMNWLAPAFTLILAASVLFSGYVPASSAQPRGQDPKGSRKDECGCYICGKLDPLQYADAAADCAGIVQENKCRQSLGSDQVSPEVRRSFCEQVKAKGCQTSMCDSPNGTYCGDNMPGKGTLYVGTKAARVYSEPSTNATLIDSPPSGTRLRYTNSTQINGQTWYYIEPPGRPKGWIPGSQLSCTRPVEPPLPRIVIPNEPNFGPSPSTPAHAHAFRG